MALSILTNVASLRAQNALDRVTKKVDKHLLRLSTGLRINSGKDDGAGLVQSEALRGKISGADRAAINVTNAAATLALAEGYLSQITELAQGMRDLFVEGADNTISDEDREALQDELTTQMAEFRRLAIGAKSNGSYLLDGSYTGKSVMAGVDEGDVIQISIADARTSALGKIALYTSQSRSATTTSLTASMVDLAGPSSITIAGVMIASNAFSSDGVSNVEASDSAIAYVNAINSYQSSTGVTAQTVSNEQTFSYASGNALGSSYHLLINGYTVKSDATVYNVGNDTDAANLVNLINTKSGSTGVTAKQDSAGDTIKLTAADGRNINVQIANISSTDSTNVYNFTGNSSNRGAVYRGTFKLTANEEFSISGATAEFSASSSVTVPVDQTLNLDNLSLGNADISGTGITILDRAIEQLQLIRSNVGAQALRFENAEAELAVRAENYSAAETAIRDADVAEETAEYTKATIIQEAASAALAQANLRAQIALTLLDSIASL